MEIYRHDFYKASGGASIFILSDVHEGTASHNEEAFKTAISQIEIISKNRPSCVVLNGDLIDCIEVSDKRFNPAEISEKYRLKDLKDLPKKQADRVLKNLSPIKHLIKYAIIGNHEESYIREHHFDVYEYYCNALGCQKLGSFGIVRFGISAVDEESSSKKKVVIKEYLILDLLMVKVVQEVKHLVILLIGSKIFLKNLM